MSSTTPVRVLVVDDSPFMRRAIAMMLTSAEGIVIAGTARDGLEACDKVAELKPDVVTLDIEMPRMDGLTALRRIMSSHPTPVIMVSSLTHEGASATLDALQFGALDFIPKESPSASFAIHEIRDTLVEKVRAVAGRHFPRPRPTLPRATSYPISLAGMKLLAIGSSTGGPFALQQILPLLPADFPIPIVVAQHMPAQFTRSLASRLNEVSALEVSEAQHGDLLLPGRVLFAPGGRHLVLRRDGDAVRATTPERPETLHRPSVNVMLESACDVYDGRVAAVILTGMGRDGREGCGVLRERGGRIIAQNEETCVVFGMPRGVIEAGLADAILPLTEIASACMDGFARTSAVAGRST